MRQVWITRKGPPEVLEVREAPDPKPRPGELRVRVEAAGINFADILSRMGLYPDAPTLPMVPGLEVAGRVDAVGDGATEDWIGRDVLAGTRFGGYSDVLCVPEPQVFVRPAGMTAEQGAAIPLNYLTAYLALVVMGALKSHERVLVHSAGGGVGLAAIDLCRIYGATVYGTASAWKHPFLQERGAAHLIDYRQADFEAEVRRLTDGRGVHIALDPLGGDSWRKSYRSLAPTGRLVVYGASAVAPGKRRRWTRVLRMFAAVPWLQFNPFQLMADSRAIVGAHLGHLGREQHRAADWMRQLLEWYRNGQYRPYVGKAFPLEAAPAAHHYIQDRRNVGKVVLICRNDGV